MMANQFDAEAPNPRPVRHFRRRVFLYLLSLSLLTSAISSGAYYFKQVDLFHQARRLRARSLLRNLATEAELGAYAKDPGLCDLPVRHTAQEQDVVFVAIYTASGQELMHQSAPNVSSPQALDREAISRLTANPETDPIEIAAADFDDLMIPIVTAVRPASDTIYGEADNNASLHHEVVGIARIALSLTPARQQVAELVRISAVLTVTLLLLGAIAALLIAGRISDPILALVRGTDEIRSGNLDVTIQISSRDEVGLLADSFNKMTARLRQTMSELESLNRNLEAEVERRTEALHLLTDELQGRNRALEQQRDQLTEMNRLKSEFLANISHELRTPLNAILGYTEIISEGVYGDVTAEQKEGLAGIIESGNNLLILINQILDLSKVESGKIELYITQVPMHDVVQAVVAESLPLTKDRPYRVTARCPIRVDVFTDAAKVKQILTNLISNAIKFTEKGSVTIELSKDLKGGCRLTVTDTGIGIRAADQELIFEEFRQVDGSSTRRFQGTGLGLAIARRFAQLLSGSLTVRSEYGKGSRFTLTLPEKPAAPRTI